MPAEREKVNVHKTGDYRILSLGMALSIILRERSSTLNAVQQILSLLMVDGACSKRILKRFNHLGLCLSPTGTHKMLDSTNTYQNAEIVNLLCEGHAFRVVGDNFDLLIRVRQMLFEHRNKSHYWFHLLVVFSRVSNSLICLLSELPTTSYLLSNEEKNAPKKDFVTITSRVLHQHLKFLTPFQDAVVKHIPHEYSKDMLKESNVLVSKTVFIEEERYDGMVEIQFFTIYDTLIERKRNVYRI